MKSITSIAILSIFAILFSCSSPPNKSKEDKSNKENQRYDNMLADKLGIFSPLPSESINDENPASLKKIELGQRLYYDKRLSKNNTISCNSCHNLSSFGVDGLSTSPGDLGELGERNSPTVLNASLHAKQFWDGRAHDVEEQAGGPILNPVEMNMDSEKMVINRLKEDKIYQELFTISFPDDKNPINYNNLTKAIGVFERQLLTPSRFDDYLNGDKKALSVQEKKGLLSFINIGCTTCHSGSTLGGNLFQKFGIYDDYWKYTKSKHIDEGRYKVTGKDYDKYVFKVPSLRNIEKTAPYYHDGSVESLTDAIDIMAKVQLNYTMNSSEKENMVAYLNSLTGDIPEKYKTNPFAE